MQLRLHRLPPVCCILLSGVGHLLAAQPGIDVRALVARSDLHYPGAVERSEDGMPIGNGRMGSLVWTTPAALHLQINRNDVQPISCTTSSFFERNSDYMGGCGFVDVDVGMAADGVFTPQNCPQHLSLADGLLEITGRGLTSRIVASAHRDVFAIELDDRRASPQPLTVSLRMLRYAAQYHAGLEALNRDHIVSIRTRQHTAASQLHIRGDRIILTQEFREGAHVAKSAVAIALVGRKAKATFGHDAEVRLTAPAGAGRVTTLVASAATLNADDDVIASALAAIDAAGGRSFDQLAEETAAAWRDFWSRGWVELHSRDGVADYVAENYHYYLYLMGATSRGRFPTKFNGMLWNTAGDLRTWGAQHWFANLSCLYEALFASNRLELLDPMFDMYSGMFDAAAVAARQQWGSEGIYIPETVWFDGLARLPDDIAAEMRELYLLRKPWPQRSDRFMAYARPRLPHSSRWNWWGGGSWVEGNWTPTERGFGPYGPVTHILGTTAKVAYLFWRRYEYTLDREWLRTRAYPMIKGAAEFYRHFPNVQPGEDGRIHIHHVNSNESVMGARDTDEDLSAMRAIFAVATRAAEILAVDPELRSEWAGFLRRLAPLPTSSDPDAIKPGDYTGPRVFVRGRNPVVNGRGFTPDGNSLPMWFFDLCNLDSRDTDLIALANATFDRALRGGPPGAGTPVGVLSKIAIAGVALGRADATRHLIPNQMRSLTAEREGAYRGGRPLLNRLSLREGHQAFDAQRLGRAAEALQLALLNSSPPGPAQEPAIRLFAAWPAEWDARFTLRARGGFVVTSGHKEGRIGFAEIHSEAGAVCRLHNPWPGEDATLTRDGKTTERLSGTLLVFPTRIGERVRLERAN